jgi:hypothetical protein
MDTTTKRSSTIALAVTAVFVVLISFVLACIRSWLRQSGSLRQAPAANLDDALLVAVQWLLVIAAIVALCVLSINWVRKGPVRRWLLITVMTLLAALTIAPSKSLVTPIADRMVNSFFGVN